MTPDSASLGLGLEVRLDATAYDAAGDPIADPTVHWSSSDDAIATVDQTGLVRGMSMGSVTVSAAYEDLEAHAAILVRPVTVLVDASRDGGVWWYPQAGTFDPDLGHQGKELADYLRSLKLHVRELPRPTLITLELLKSHDLVIRAVACGDYAGSEVLAYQQYVQEGGSLLLLDDHKRHCPIDAVGLSFGLRFDGITRGFQSLTFVPDPITQDLEDGSLRLIAGSGLTEFPSEAKILAHLDEESYLDLNDNGAKDIDEPTAPPVMGTLTSGKGLIIFMGDANFIEYVPQPLTDNLIQALLPGVIEVDALTAGAEYGYTRIGEWIEQHQRTNRVVGANDSPSLRPYLGAEQACGASSAPSNSAETDSAVRCKM